MSVLQKVAIDANGNRPIGGSVFDPQRLRRIGDLYSEVWKSRSGKISVIQLAMYGTKLYAGQLAKFAKESRRDEFIHPVGAQVFKEQYYNTLFAAVNKVILELKRLRIPEQHISPFGQDQFAKIRVKFNASGDQFISAHEAVMYVDGLRNQDTISVGGGTYNEPSYLKGMEPQPEDKKIKSFKNKDIESRIFPRIKLENIGPTTILLEKEG